MVISANAVKSITVSLLLGAGVLLFQNCTESAFVVDPSISSNIDRTRFNQAQSVLASNCLSCHASGSPQGSVAHNTEQGFVQAGWVTPQDPTTSKLITRLHNYPHKNGAQNMPPTGPLSDRDFQILVTWIENMSMSAADLSCAPNESVQPAKLKRLTPIQFRNSLQSVYGNIFADGDFPDFGDANPRIGMADNPNLLGINEINISALYESSDLLVNKIIANNTTISNCLTGSGTTCFDNIIQQQGRLLWRRPLTTAERSAISSKLPGISAGGLSRTVQAQFVLKALILSPNHLFRTEIGQGQTNGIFRLTHYEVASLLSFAAWDSPPDATLLSLAEQSRLHDINVLKQQVTRLTSDSRFNQKLTTFVVDLLKIENIHTIRKDSSFNITSTERQALYQSALRSIASAYSNANADLFAPFKMTQFLLNNQTSRFMSGGSTAQYSPIPLNQSERYGVLSHPAFLTSIAGEISTGIVRRGVFTLEQLLCDKMPAAPADVTSDPNTPPGFDPDATSTREILTITHSSRSDCMGCHVKIDPAGFAFESFDTFGRFRMFEKGNIPIDSSGSLAGIDSHPIVFNDSVAFFRELNNSASFKACITKRFFEYTTGFVEDNNSQKCEAANFQRNLNAKPQNKSSLLEAVVELPSFINRRPAGAR